MKAAPAASLLLLFLSLSVFGHGVERGSIWSGIANSELGLLSEATRQEITDAVEGHCDLTGIVSASAEFAETDGTVPAIGPRGFRIHIRVQLENRAATELIVVNAYEKGLPATGETAAMEYTVESSICR
jgi:hypothetical protein